MPARVTLCTVIGMECLELLDAWAVFALATTCREALAGNAKLLQNLHDAADALRSVSTYLMEAGLRMPGFEHAEDIDMMSGWLRVWDPPYHRSVRYESVPDFMWNSFKYPAAGNMEEWIQWQLYESQRQAISPLEAVRRLNPTVQGDANFEKLLSLLAAGQATFFYSPLVLDATGDRDHGPSDCTGPGLMILFKYHGFPMAFCFRYTERAFMEKLFWPWVDSLEGMVLRR